MTEQIELSAIVPVTERYDDVAELYSKYRNGIRATGLSYEFVYVLDGDYPKVLQALKSLRENGEKITIITLAKWFGESVALNVGFEHSCGEIVLTLPAYEQIGACEIPRLIESLGKDDMVLAWRWPRQNSVINRVPAGVFNLLLRKITGVSIHDAGCSARAFRRRILDEVYVYGDLHRFLPVMAYRQGYKIRELKVAQSERDAMRRVYSPGVYIRRLLDLLTVFFLVKFTKKPLRFFGLVGLSTLGVGTLYILYILTERLLFGVSLTNRPGLFLSALLIVLGIQTLAIGLIGEIVIFTHAQDYKEYTIEEIVN